MLRAMRVTFSMSLDAPVVISPKMISSATRPPKLTAIWSRNLARVTYIMSSPNGSM